VRKSESLQNDINSPILMKTFIRLDYNTTSEFYTHDQTENLIISDVVFTVGYWAYSAAAKAVALRCKTM